MVNVDTTIIAPQPKLKPHLLGRPETKDAELGLTVNEVNIKGKNNEKLGYLGREEGIEAQAVVLLVSA